MDVNIHFLGAAETVTGSKFLVETPGYVIMIDCGLFQGLKPLRLINWEKLLFDASKIDVVLLTHGHLDHVGYLPCLVKQGFSGKIIGTAPTLSIARIILRDSAKIHEEEAQKANEEGYSKHEPALPLYNCLEAEKAIDLFCPEPRGNKIILAPDISFQFKYNAHILGACFIELNIRGKCLVFSGDIGRTEDPLLFPPEKPIKADYLFMESTYGDTLHTEENIQETMVTLAKETIHNRGNLIIPSFAVERAQMLVYTLWKLYKKNRIPNVPIIIDSPMGIDVMNIFKKYLNWHKLPLDEYEAMCKHLQCVSSYRETWEIIDNPQPKIIIAGSGMITGGRVLTYLKQLIDKVSTTILLVGYQAEGTRGRDLLEGVKQLKFFGKFYPVQAKIVSLKSLSAHADQKELLNWVSNIENTPKKVFLIHGEDAAINTFKKEIELHYKWDVSVPKLNDVYSLTL